MQLDLSDDDARMLRDILHDYVPALRMEVARTDQRDFRHEMERRQELCERLLDTLERAKL